MKIKRVLTIAVVVMMLFSLSGCGGGLSGTYKLKDDYYIEFKDNGTCTWHQMSMYFEGKYSKKNGGYELKIEGSGMFPSVSFMAKADGNDLIISGGDLGTEGMKFIKQ